MGVPPKIERLTIYEGKLTGMLLLSTAADIWQGSGHQSNFKGFLWVMCFLPLNMTKDQYS